MGSYGLIANVCESLDKKKITPKGLNQFRSGWDGMMLNMVAEAIADGLLSGRDLVDELIYHAKPRDWPISKDQHRARAILGERLISPAELSAMLYVKLVFSEEQREQLEQIPFTDEELLDEMEKSNGNVLLYPMHSSMSVAWLAEHASNVYGPCGFMTAADKHWAYVYSITSEKDKAVDGKLSWRLVRTKLISDEGGYLKEFDQIKHLIPKTHRLVSYIEAVLQYFLFQRLFGQNMYKLSGGRTFTADTSLVVGVGSDIRSIYINTHEDRGSLLLARDPAVSWEPLSTPEK